MPTLAARLLIDDEMAGALAREMDARVQLSESGENPSHTHEEVMAELDAVIV